LIHVVYAQGPFDPAANRVFDVFAGVTRDNYKANLDKAAWRKQRECFV
jgi:hypothetical protein